MMSGSDALVAASLVVAAIQALERRGKKPTQKEETMVLKTYAGEWLIQDEALWRWSIDKGGYNRIGALEDLVPYEEPPAGGDETTWKVEDGMLWKWNPSEAFPGWWRVGPLEELFRREPALELPACTVEQALGCGGAVLRRAEEPLRSLFPDLDVAVFEEGPRIHEIMGRVPPARRALALALRALSDRLLEVAGS